MLDHPTEKPARQERLDALFLQKAIRSRSQVLRRPGHAAPAPFRDGLEGYPFVREALGFDMSGFRDFAIRHARHSHGQLLQDLWVAFELGGKRGGFFVEFGATNGMTFSNTLLLERQFGWTGILAEPNPVFHPKLRAARTARISTRAVHALSGRPAEFLCASRPMMSRLAGFGEALPGPEIAATVTVETISLDDLLDAHDAPDRIDFLSVDTEGSELEILSAFDFARRPVTLVAVEHNHGTRHAALHRLLTGHGYVLRAPALSRFDGWYRHASTL